MPRSKRKKRTERPISEHGLCPQCDSIIWQGAPPQPSEFPIDCPGGHVVSLDSLPEEYFVGEEAEAEIAPPEEETTEEDPASESPGSTFPCPHCGTNINIDDVPAPVEPAPQEETKPPEAPRHQCPDCTRSSDLTRHINKVHPVG